MLYLPLIWAIVKNIHLVLFYVLAAYSTILKNLLSGILHGEKNVKKLSAAFNSDLNPAKGES